MPTVISFGNTRVVGPGLLSAQHSSLVCLTVLEMYAACNVCTLFTHQEPKNPTIIGHCSWERNCVTIQ